MCILLIQTYEVHDYLFVPLLDGTEQIYQINGTTTISNGEMSGGSSFLLTSFDSTGDWEITGKVKYSGNNCCVHILPPTQTSREGNELAMTAFRTSTFWYNNGTFNELYTERRHLTANQYYDFSIKKENGVITTTIDNLTRTVSNWSIISSASSLSIGVAGWSTSGNVCTIKDIVVKPL